MFQSRARTRKEQVQLFWNEADFGYVDERLKEMTVLCEPQNQVRSLVPRIDIKNTLRYIYIYNIWHIGCGLHWVIYQQQNWTYVMA